MPLIFLATSFTRIMIFSYCTTLYRFCSSYSFYWTCSNL